MTRHEYPYLVAAPGNVFHCEDASEVWDVVGSLIAGHEIEPRRIEIRGGTFALPALGVPGLVELPEDPPVAPADTMPGGRTIQAPERPVPVQNPGTGRA